MMIELFRDQRRASHEAERLVEVLEHELSGDGIAAFHLTPAVKLGKRALARITGEFRCHGRHLVIAAIVPRMARRQPLAKAPRALTYLPESRPVDLPPRTIGRALHDAALDLPRRLRWPGRSISAGSPERRFASTSLSCCFSAGSSLPAGWRADRRRPGKASPSWCSCSPAWWRTNSATSSRPAPLACRPPT